MKAGQWLGKIKDHFNYEHLKLEFEWVHKRINEVFLVGDIVLDRELIASGLTGAKTINRQAGVVRFAAAATSLRVTNSKVNENSIVLCSLLTNDASAVLGSVVSGDGFFTIHLSAAPAAETRCGFLVTN
jgi:hypothetical protein